MKDKDGFDIRCVHSDWMVIDNRDNKDFVCRKFPTYNYSAHLCYADENCRYYEPDSKEGVENA